MLSTTPPLRSRIESRQASVTLITPITLTSKRLRISLRDNAPNGWLYFIRCSPALLITMSMPPNRPIVVATAASTRSASATSQSTAIACPPAETSSAAVRSAMSTSMSAITTLAPSATSARANARPKPIAPPVITAVRLSNLIAGILTAVVGTVNVVLTP
jgi:hypothetical protein